MPGHQRSHRLPRLKAILLATVLFIVTLMTAVLLSAQQLPSIDEIYIFGDSLSDTGRVFRATNGAYPPNPPYFEGRYSNGQVWIEHLTRKLSIQRVNNFAYGGATTTGDRNSLVPGLVSQVQLFTQSQRNFNTEALYVLWAGANDYLQGVADPAIPVRNITSAIATLSNAGADKFLVVNLPDLGRLPTTRVDGNSGQLSRLTESHNSGLRRSLKQLQQNDSSLQIVTLDVYSLYQQAIAQPTTFGLTNVTQSCLTGSQSCRQPEQFLFWDGIHPTTAGHKILAERAIDVLEQELLVPTQP